MWRCHDPASEAAAVLQGKVWYPDVRSEQALSPDGETAQPRAGRRRPCLHKDGCCSRGRVHVQGKGAGERCDQGDIQQGAGQRRLCRTALYGPPEVFHDRPERNLVRASVSPEEQLEGEEPLHLRQLQPDQHGRSLRVPDFDGTASPDIFRHLHDAGTDGAQARQGERKGLPRSQGERS